MKCLSWEPHFPDQLDDKITKWMRTYWHRFALLDASMMIIGQWTPIVMLAVIVVASTGIFLPPTLHSLALKSAFLAIASALTARAVNEPISRWANRPRPFEREVVGSLLKHDEGKAFPSNHATGAFALAMSFTLVPGYAGILLVLAIILAVARVYSGLHHFTDILAGALHGTAVAWLLLEVFWQLHLVSTVAVR